MIAIVFLGLFTLGFGYKNSPEPNNYYEVYLNDELLGVIKNEKTLESYIDKKW